MYMKLKFFFGSWNVRLLCFTRNILFFMIRTGWHALFSNQKKANVVLMDLFCFSLGFLCVFFLNWYDCFYRFYLFFTDSIKQFIKSFCLQQLLFIFSFTAIQLVIPHTIHYILRWRFFYFIDFMCRSTHNFWHIFHRFPSLFHKSTIQFCN